ncbi:hypothetical protein EDE15_0552 [Edaphobacter aggregans]|uniref:Uncharacterized protein n=2 Tax=Edaphobacter aggregans TaxID=570835 RepID=A0A3R9NUS9_9BACT|nr:hypothetical protein EDE15_0552 [Edaphobacter aggregans]
MEMKRGLGAAGIGAAALAGAMFHATISRDGNSSASKSQPISAQSVVTGEGPWLASCSYWSAARWKEPPTAKKPPQSTKSIKQAAVKADSPATASTDNPETSCASDNWGIPPPEPDHEPDIRAIIATVPDPIHSHFALEFDRTIDAFMQAASDNRFLESQYWLPWKSRIAPPSSGDSSTIPPESEQDLKREQQPGLIILKFAPKAGAGESDVAWSGYHRVIYLFLVGETPALGVNGTQLRNALRYEAMLKKDYKARLSMGEGNRLAIIGPFSSGSAASLREGLENAKFDHAPPEIIVAGETSTGIANSELNSQKKGEQKITYVSFAENTGFELSRLFDALNKSRYDVRRIAILVEEGTVFGDANASGKQGGIQIRFPREISLLRNAQIDQGGKSSGESSAAPSPYLNLSLKDSDADDTVPHFSSAQTPLSQEAELMAIARQLQRNRTQYILIAGSNILDEIFLAQFLHRACPDARLVFYNGGDLLIERDVDNVPYIGSIVITPYTLIDLENANGSARAFSDAHAERAYNAASYIFWFGTSNSKPTFAGYQRTANDTMQIPLWATTVGGDGYYPLGILSPCASDTRTILPNIVEGSLKVCSQTDGQFRPRLAPASPNSAPSLFWFVLCTLITSLCIGHTTVMLSAEYWSAFTRDLAVRQNDQPRRRSVYINIGTSVLFSMAFVVSFPLFAMLFPLFSTDRFYFVDTPSLTVASITLLSGFAALIATLSRTLPHSGRAKGINPESTTRLYPYFNLVALITVVAVPLLWIWICLRTTVDGTASYVGPFFSYRSLHPTSGVSPVVPILLLLFSWYLWSVFQTARLRFSTMSRPRLPDNVPTKSPYPLFVSDSALTQCKTPIDSCLIENVTCLLITRETIRRFTGWSATKLNAIFFAIYLGLFAICIFCGHIQSLERFLLHPGHWPTAYEFLIATLFFPLIMVALTGWLRMIFIWGALSRGLLEPLERTPLRLAFTRLKDVGWMTMLSQSSLHFRWRDMARSTESLRQLINNPDLAQAIGEGAHWKDLSDTYDELIDQITELRKRITMRPPPKPEPNPPAAPPGDDDLPEEDHRYDLGYIYRIEMLYAKFCEHLLAYLLIPYWNERRVGFVEEGEGEHPGSDSSKSIPDPDAPEDPTHIRLAEELLTIRYVALIRAVLVNTRYLMLFVSSAFVFAIIAWNSYPFQPHQLIDWCFTLLMVFLGCGFIWVFAQMHRNAILSRITDTKPNELGRDFYIRVISFGAIPVLTWFAYQFPEIGGSIFKILQPSLQVIK